jgi:hypothetical protein
MKYPQLFFLPLLMLADYLLTVRVAALKAKHYDNHFKTQHYELNPVWQKNIAELKWLNPKHLALAALVTVLLFILLEVIELPRWFAQGVLGCVLLVFGMLIARHISNWLVVSYVTAHPNEITGSVTMSHSMQLWISLFQYVVAFIPMIMLTMFLREPYAVGGALACVMMILVHLKWISAHRKNGVQR